ncbi:MAG: sn-glycerol-3-phosphate ABC transporter ATP-binding protein UgpC [Shinella sp.]|nr:sn-glycerol-3-phosphate ABC transporter ATP-binding protein UgpC [Shinella sp.]
MSKLILRNVVKSYGGHFQVVHGIDLEVADEEFVVLVGPSGCGKSTTLRMIAGLETVTGGKILIGDDVVNDLPARRRDIAMVFQNYALYPHLTVFENMAFGLRLRNHPEDEIKKSVAEAARILGLESLLERHPRALSGGQRQRVAMGRAIVRHPKLFLFDEPLSNLDAKLRMQMRGEIKRVHQAIRTTTIYVTHDQVEAMTLADRVVVMNAGHIEQIAAPQELYVAPASRFVATFIGSPGMNVLPARLAEEDGRLLAVLDNGSRVALAPGAPSRYRAHIGRTVLFGVRPEHLGENVTGTGLSELSVDVTLVEPLGMETLVHGRIGSAEIIARCSPAVRAASGQALPLAVAAENVVLFDATTEHAL